MRPILAVLPLGLALACDPPQPPTPAPSVEATVVGAAAAPTSWPLNPPDPASMPEGPLGDSIRRGEVLVRHTVAKAGPWVGIAGVFPQYRSRNDQVITLADRVNDCFERSMNGSPLPLDSADMTAILAYMTWLSQGVPVGLSVQGRGFPHLDAPPPPDPAHGRVLYAERCVACHGADGQGVSGPDGEPVFPPLWGDRSFNISAGMARQNTAAAFVRWNMPLGQGGSLSDQDAQDLAAFFTVQPRPDFARKGEDWAHGGRPADARY
jgi:thiosulfate dehydrogenase